VCKHLVLQLQATAWWMMQAQPHQQHSKHSLGVSQGQQAAVPHWVTQHLQVLQQALQRLWLHRELQGMPSVPQPQMLEPLPQHLETLWSQSTSISLLMLRGLASVRAGLQGVLGVQRLQLVPSRHNTGSCLCLCSYCKARLERQPLAQG
jgi:hypothetical protein